MSLCSRRIGTLFVMSLILSANAVITHQITESGRKPAIRHVHYSSGRGTLPTQQGFRLVNSDSDHAFNKIVQLGPAVTPADLAEGVQSALITTLMGLIVAIPAIGFFFYFRNRVVRITYEFKAIAEDLIERFRPQVRG